MPEKVHVRFDDEGKVVIQSADSQVLQSDSTQTQAQGVKRSRDGSPKPSSPKPPKWSTLVPTVSKPSRPISSIPSNGSQTHDARKAKKDAAATKNATMDKRKKQTNNEKKSIRTTAPKSFYGSGTMATNAPRSETPFNVAPDVLGHSANGSGNFSITSSNGSQPAKFSNGSSITQSLSTSGNVQRHAATASSSSPKLGKSLTGLSNISSKFGKASGNANTMLNDTSVDGSELKPQKILGNDAIPTNGPQAVNILDGNINGVTKKTKVSDDNIAVQRPSETAVDFKKNSTLVQSQEISQSKRSLLPQKPNRHQIARTKSLLSQSRQNLPIWKHRADIRWGLRQADVLLLIGETGSGKSTQVPQFLLDEPWFKPQLVKITDESGQVMDATVGGMIVITEPRRVAATSLAHRVAQETGSYIGHKSLSDNRDEVGYSVRFETYMPSHARIKYLTEGMLLQEMLHDPHLRKYSAIIIDEIHERSVDVDLIAGFVKNILTSDQKGRGGVPLKVVVMSATANMESLQRFFSTSSTAVSQSISSNSGPEIHGMNSNPPSESNETAPQGVDIEDLNGAPNDIEFKDLQFQRNGGSRRESDASYSSWEGISSDDEIGKELEGSPNTDRSSSGPPQPVPGDVAIHYITGKQYDVQIFYSAEPVTDYIQATLKTVFQIHTKEPLPGDILAFLTGRDEIESLQQLIEQQAEKLSKDIPRLDVIPLYGQLSMEDQAKAFKRARNQRTRKVVLATNIAETSITVPGVYFVVDCGKAKVKRYRSGVGLESLLVTEISKSSAIQRKGRAGREGKGKCYRLYTETDFSRMRKADDPEILRSNITEAVLKMKARGVNDVLSFPMMSPLDPIDIREALFDLQDIDALDDGFSLTETGRRMSEFPLSAAYARALVAAAEPDVDCLLEAIDVLSCLTAAEDIFIQPKTEEKREEMSENRRDLLRREGDVLTYLTTMQKFASEKTDRAAWCKHRSVSYSTMKRALEIRRQLRHMSQQAGMLAERVPPDPQPFEPMTPERAEILLKCFLKSFVLRTAKVHPNGSYITNRGRNAVWIHPSSVLYGKKKESIMFLEHVYTQKNWAKKVSVIQEVWLAEGASP